MARTFFALSLLMTAVPAAASTLNGQGRAMDGDSLMVGQTEVRLFGIDAPELSQSCTRAGQPWSCGSAAKEQLSKHVAGQPVSCAVVGKDQHGRTLGRCRAGGRDLNQTMVATGFALAYRRYAMDYVSAEETARLYKRGIWAGTFEQPSEVRYAGEDYVVSPRSTEREPASRPPIIVNSKSKPQPGGTCRIKGNHSRRGEKIYHLPGMPYYAETRAEEIFCSEAQARAAGYRRSRADQHR